MNILPKKAEIQNARLSEQLLPQFWSHSTPKRAVTVVRIPPSPDGHLPVRSFIAKPGEPGGIAHHQRSNADIKEVDWQLRHVLRGPSGWSSIGALEQQTPYPPDVLTLRPWPATNELSLIIRHPTWVEVVRLNSSNKPADSTILHEVIGAAFSADGQTLALARANGTLYFGKMKQYIRNRVYLAKETATYLDDCQSFDLALGQLKLKLGSESTSDLPKPLGGELFNCQIALDSTGDNVFLIAHCSATEKQDDGSIKLLEQRARVWLTRNPANKRLRCKFSAKGEYEDWALSVICHEPPVAASEALMESHSTSKRKMRPRKPAVPASAPAFPSPGGDVLGKGVSGIYSGLSNYHHQMGGSSMQGALIAPAVQPSPNALTGLLVLDATTIVDWHPAGIRVLSLEASKERAKLTASLLSQWAPEEGERILAVQDVQHCHLYIYVASQK